MLVKGIIKKICESLFGEIERQDGIYIIEDVSFGDVIRYKDYFSKHGDAFEARFVYLKSPLVEFGENNNLVCVTRKAMD